MIDLRDHHARLELSRDTFRARIADGSATQRDKDELASRARASRPALV